MDSFRHHYLTFEFEQDLPEVADIIRPYVSTTGAIASSSGTVVVQRSTVKATTFDGKSVFFRRKPKRIGTILQVNARCLRAVKYSLIGI